MYILELIYYCKKPEFFIQKIITSCETHVQATPEQIS